MMKKNIYYGMDDVSVKIPQGKGVISNKKIFFANGIS
ncbi:hypothetical protein SAMN05444267_10527 [Chryseobacterium polytrichastri]|uniref:Uncharacterized protein n=1 Tax=Chryseobacterium polytrichastri TaxID=1302687 RepID=A0A1M7JFY6_9FLAO|nr:hypothetical protein SAMN05444267_10527 [Chryseobacterium polytrichastri]